MAGIEGGGRTALMKGLQGASIDEVFIHEKKQKLFKYARDKDHQDDLYVDLTDRSPDLIPSDGKTHEQWPKIFVKQKLISEYCNTIKSAIKPI